MWGGIHMSQGPPKTPVGDRVCPPHILFKKRLTFIINKSIMYSTVAPFQLCRTPPLYRGGIKACDICK